MEKELVFLLHQQLLRMKGARRCQAKTFLRTLARVQSSAGNVRLGVDEIMLTLECGIQGLTAEGSWSLHEVLSDLPDASPILSLYFFSRVWGRESPGDFILGENV